MYLYLPLAISRLFYILARDSSDVELGSFIIAVIIAGVFQGVIMYIGTRSSLYRNRVFSFLSALYILFFGAHTAVIAGNLACDMYYNSTGIAIYVGLILLAGWCCVYFGTKSVLRACTMLIGGILLAIGGLMLGAAQQTSLMPAVINWEFSAMGTASAALEILSFSTELVLINELVYHTSKPSVKGIIIFNITAVITQLAIILLVVYTLGAYAGFSDSPVLTLSRVLGAIGKADAEAVYLTTWLITGTIRTALMFSLANSAGERVSRGAYIVLLPASIIFALLVNAINSTAIIGIATVLTLFVGVAIPVVGLIVYIRKKNA